MPVGEDVAHAMEGGDVCEGLQVGGLGALDALLGVPLHGGGS